MEFVLPAVPAANRFPGHVIQEPTLTGVGAVLMNLGVNHVVVVGHDLSLEGVDDRELTALDIELGTIGKVLVVGHAVASKTIVRNGQVTSIQRVEEGGRRCVRMHGSLLRCCLFCFSQDTARALCKPRWEVILTRDLGHEAADVSVVRRIAFEHRVVNIPGLLLPRIKYHLFKGLIGMKRRDDTLGRIVNKDRANAYTFCELKLLGCAEKWFVLAYCFSLVIEDGPAAAYPTGIHRWTTFRQRSRRRLHFFLYLAVETVRVGK